MINKLERIRQGDNTDEQRRWHQQRERDFAEHRKGPDPIHLGGLVKVARDICRPAR